jgi:hypothetical protein
VKACGNKSLSLFPRRSLWIETNGEFRSGSLQNTAQQLSKCFG